jgi:hypothetical protein
VIDHFEPSVARFLLRIDRPIRGGHHGIALFNRDGQVVWGTHQPDLDLDPGMYEIVYRMSLPVKPGAYRWQVALFEGSHFIDGGDLLPELSVETPPLGHRLDEYSGFLNLPYAFDVRRVDRTSAEHASEALSAIAR